MTATSEGIRYVACLVSGNDIADAYIYMIPQQIDCVHAHLLEVGQVVAMHACMHVNLVPGTKVRAYVEKLCPHGIYSHIMKYTKTYMATHTIVYTVELDLVSPSTHILIHT